MSRKATLIFSLVAVVVAMTSFFIIPASLKTGGGSCYQGIGVTVYRFLLIICNGFIVFSLINDNKKNAFVLSSISLAVWTLWSLLHLRVSIIDFLYLLPFLILNIMLVIMCYKAKNNYEKH